MRDFDFIVRELQDDEDFCDFTEKELIELVEYTNEEIEGDFSDGLLNKSSSNTGNINKKGCKQGCN